MIDSIEALTEEEMNKAFRYYNYVREFYGYLCDSLDLVFEDGCDEFNPAYAPAEKEFPPTEGIDENSAAKAKTIDEMSRTIRAYETMQSIIAILDMDGVEKAAQVRGMMQDTHKFALTSIAEWFPIPGIWHEFDDYAYGLLYKYANDAQSAVSLMEPLALESAIHKIFAEQKECLEKFLPQKIETLKKLKAEMENSYKGKMDWSNHLCQRELVDVVTDYAFALDTLDDYDHQRLTLRKSTTVEKFRATYENAMAAIQGLKEKFGGSELFAHEKDESFKSSIGQIYQTFGGAELYPSVEQKAAMLLYLVTKNHSFSDGNKRIAATLFLWFLLNNGILYKDDGSKRIADATLVTMTLMIAESRPEDMEMMVKIVVNLMG